MKSCFVAVVLLTIAAVAPVSVAQDPDAEAEAACAKEHNVDVAVADQALSDNKDLTEDILCYAKCTMQTMGVIEPSGKMNVDTTVKRMGLEGAPAEQVAVVKAMLNSCIQKTPEPEACGFGYEVMQCVLRDAKALMADKT